MTNTKQLHEAHHEIDARAQLGFWIYLMTDCVLFACLFATYIVLKNNTFGGPDSALIINLPYTLTQTIVLLCTSLTVGFVSVAAKKGSKAGVIAWSFVTFVIGCVFLYLMLHDFSQLMAQGNGWQKSGFLTGYFNIVGTHGIHVAFGLIWILVMIGQVAAKGLTSFTQRRLSLMRMFWHFLELIWVFIFTIVYLMGAK